MSEAMWILAAFGLLSAIRAFGFRSRDVTGWAAETTPGLIAAVCWLVAGVGLSVGGQWLGAGLLVLAGLIATSAVGNVRQGQQISVWRHIDSDATTLAIVGQYVPVLSALTIVGALVGAIALTASGRVWGLSLLLLVPAAAAAGLRSLRRGLAHELQSSSTENG